MFENYLKIAFRNIKKQKGYALLNITGLAGDLLCDQDLLAFEISVSDLYGNPYICSGGPAFLFYRFGYGQLPVNKNGAGESCRLTDVRIAIGLKGGNVMWANAFRAIFGLSVASWMKILWAENGE